jgi:hypothetical protein
MPPLHKEERKCTKNEHIITGKAFGKVILQVFINCFCDIYITENIYCANKIKLNTNCSYNLLIGS